MSTGNFGSRLAMALACTALALAAGAVAAQTYPSKPIEFIVHTTPGGGTDLFARAVTEMLTQQKLLPQPVNVMNRAGGSGTVAFTYIKSKRGDPHTVLAVATGTFLTAATRTDVELGLDNYTPLAFFANDPQAIMVSADSRFATVKDLIEAGRREPNSIVCSVASAGGTARLFLYLIERETGAKFKFVAFKSGADAVLAVAGGHVHFTTENMSEAFAQIEAKKMRVLAVSTEKRISAVPEVVTLRELGYPIHVGTGRGFAMPAAVPKEAAAFMEATLERVHRSKAWKDHSARNLYEDLYMGSAEFAQYLAKRRVEMQEFLTSIGLGQK